MFYDEEHPLHNSITSHRDRHRLARMSYRQSGQVLPQAGGQQLDSQQLDSQQLDSQQLEFLQQGYPTATPDWMRTVSVCGYIRYEDEHVIAHRRSPKGSLKRLQRIYTEMHPSA